MNENLGSPQPSQRRRAKLIFLLSIASYASTALTALYMHYKLYDLEMTVLALFPVCFFLAILTIVLAAEQLAGIKSGRFDASSKGLAKAGQILAIASMVLTPIAFLGLFGGPDYASPRDLVINDIGNISADAYQYRIRPKEMGGGDGSYFGFTLPPKMVKMEFGTYTVSIMHRDTLRITGASPDGKGSVVAYMDSSGRLFKWEYGGEFKEESK